MNYRAYFTDRAPVTARNVASERDAISMVSGMGRLERVEMLEDASAPAMSMADARAHTDAFYRRNAAEYIARTSA